MFLSMFLLLILRLEKCVSYSIDRYSLFFDLNKYLELSEIFIHLFVIVHVTAIGMSA